MPFKVKTVESALQEKKQNLFTLLKTEYNITETQLEGIDMMMRTSDHKSSLTQFARTHLGGVDRDRVDFTGLASADVLYRAVRGAASVRACGSRVV